MIKWIQYLAASAVIIIAAMFIVFMVILSAKMIDRAWNEKRPQSAGVSELVCKVAKKGQTDDGVRAYLLLCTDAQSK